MSEAIENAVKRIIESGHQISADGLEYIMSFEEEKREKFVKQALLKAKSSTKNIIILDRLFLQSIFEPPLERPSPIKPRIGKRIKQPLASEYDANLEVLEDYESDENGSYEGFLEYFRSRYSKIAGILRRRLDVKDSVTIGEALQMPPRSKLKIIGIVTGKQIRGNRLFLDVEDTEHSVTVMASDEELVRKGLKILNDQVICIEVIKYREDFLIANDFIWPDIPKKTSRRSDIPLCAAFLADLQVGSKFFLNPLFDRFLRWINLDLGTPESKKLAERIKYVIIAGDLVDGIGVYPDQIKELNIVDIKKQYEVASEIITNLPDYIEVIIIPGNHDAVRNSLPQPPISKEYAESLHADNRIHMHGNPSRFLINGVEALVCHGKGLDDVLSQTPGFDFHSPANGMELLLKCRHVAPIYGATTPIAPQREDKLVISSSPDIFHMGHVHVHDTKKYRGVNIIASGTWQSQTPFQKRLNLVPTPGIATIMDLQTHQLFTLDFSTLG